MMLVAPALGDPALDRPSLVVVPDGILALLPFEALVTRIEKEPAAFSRMRFLLLEKRLVVSPSAAVCVELAGDSDGEKGKMRDLLPILALGNPAPGRVLLDTPADQFRSPELREIPAALREVKTIAALFPGCDLYVNEAATEEVLKQPGAMDGHRIVHIAAHGIFDAREPRLSGLQLASDPEGNEDGLLMMIEVLGLQIKADLVVLSGCRTALGKRVLGEGVIGLPWAFLYAGARSVIVSLWAVNDASTARLMENFYRNLVSKGLDKAESLRQAKIELLQGDYPAPQHWAPFILIGDGGGHNTD